MQESYICMPTKDSSWAVDGCCGEVGMATDDDEKYLESPGDRSAGKEEKADGVGGGRTPPELAKSHLSVAFSPNRLLVFGEKAEPNGKELEKALAGCTGGKLKPLAESSGMTK
jgi:hypothetical protein